MFDRVYGNQIDNHNREVFRAKNDIQTTYACTSAPFGTYHDSVRAQNIAARKQRWVKQGDYLVPVNN